MLASCFTDLSRAELAHIRRCQIIAQAERLSVVSQGVLAAAAGGAPAGAHFWLVGSPSSGAVSFVWLSAGGHRLLCGCLRRRRGALSCAHAQTVRLWLLAAAGVVVSSGVVGASAPTPAPVVRVVVIAPRWRGRWARGMTFSSDETIHLPVRLRAWSADPGSFGVVTIAPRLRLRRRLLARFPSLVPPVAPVAEPAPVAPCPGCGELAPVATLITWDVCLDCLDLMAEAEHTRIIRCRDCGRNAAVGETANGAFCQDCIADRRKDYGRESDARLGVAEIPD